MQLYRKKNEDAETPTSTVCFRENVWKSHGDSFLFDILFARSLFVLIVKHQGKESSFVNRDSCTNQCFCKFVTVKCFCIVDLFSTHEHNSYHFTQ